MNLYLDFSLSLNKLRGDYEKKLLILICSHTLKQYTFFSCGIVRSKKRDLFFKQNLYVLENCK